MDNGYGVKVYNVSNNGIISHTTSILQHSKKCLNVLRNTNFSNVGYSDHGVK